MIILWKLIKNLLFKLVLIIRWMTNMLKIKKRIRRKNQRKKRVNQVKRNLVNKARKNKEKKVQKAKRKNQTRKIVNKNQKGLQ